jgi:hypothetical protein
MAERAFYFLLTLALAGDMPVNKARADAAVKGTVEAVKPAQRHALPIAQTAVLRSVAGKLGSA